MANYNLAICKMQKEIRNKASNTCIKVQPAVQMKTLSNTSYTAYTNPIHLLLNVRMYVTKISRMNTLKN